MKTTDLVCVSVMGPGEEGERERRPKCTESDVVELDDRAWWTLISFRQVLQTACQSGDQTWNEYDRQTGR